MIDSNKWFDLGVSFGLEVDAAHKRGEVTPKLSYSKDYLANIDILETKTFENHDFWKEHYLMKGYYFGKNLRK